MKICFISDTHASHKTQLFSIPECDILIHGGDITHRGEEHLLIDFLDWFKKQPAEYKVFIAGNHDFCFQRQPLGMMALLEERGYCHKNNPQTKLIYLEDNAVTINGLKIYGSPWQPWFRNWAFNLRSQDELEAQWALIPEDTDILVTHGPPYGLGDRCEDGRLVGCKKLLERIKVVKPKYHLFGHIHESWGVHRSPSLETVFCNGSVAGGPEHGYIWPKNPPIVFEV